MSDRDPILLIEDILGACSKIEKYTKGLTFHEFEQNDLIIDAVIRNFEIIGEAANRLPEEFKKQHSDIEWHRIRGFRNRIVHGYFGVDLEILWKIKNENLQSLQDQLEDILN